MRIDNPISNNAIITGSFTGSFKGDGTNLTGVTAEWDGSHVGDANITGSLTVAGNILPAAANTYDLGSATQYFKSAYISAATINLVNTSTGAVEKSLSADSVVTQEELASSLPSGVVSGSAQITISGTTGYSTLNDAVVANTAKISFDSVSSTKLAGIEANATADQSAAEIKTAYESNADTNAFDDAAVSKLAGIEAGATGDQTAVEIKSAYESNADTNEFSDAEKAKLAGLEAGAEVNVVTSVASKTGDVSLVKGDVGLGNVDNTSDANKPISTATQTALDGKQDAGSFVTTTSAQALSSAANALTLVGNTLTLSRGDSTTDTIDLSAYLDEDSRAISSGTLNGGTGIVTFTRDDASTFTLDLSDLLDDTNLVTSVNGRNGVVTTTLADYSITATAAEINKLDGVTATTAELNYVDGVTSNIQTQLNGKQAAGTYNTVIGTDSDISYTGATVLSAMTMTDGVVQSHSSRTLTLGNLGYTGATNANYITNNNQLTNGAGYITSYVNTTYSAGTGLGLSGTTFSHSDTSTQASVNNSGRTYIQDITLDGFGHVTGIASATETVVNTDTNTTYTAGNGLTLSGTQFLMSGTYTGNFSATGDISAYSDSRLKKDVNTIEGALAKTNSLRGVEFTRIADDTKSIGVIAQELEAVLPELVLTDDKGMKSVNYAQITGLLIEAVKELSAKVDELSK